MGQFTGCANGAVNRLIYFFFNLAVKSRSQHLSGTDAAAAAAAAGIVAAVVSIT